MMVMMRLFGVSTSTVTEMAQKNVTTIAVVLSFENAAVVNPTAILLLSCFELLSGGVNIL